MDRYRRLNEQIELALSQPIDHLTVIRLMNQRLELLRQQVEAIRPPKKDEEDDE
jgi:hypothetical protein